MGGSFSDIAGERRCGAKERDIWAVTTNTDAIPRRPWVLLISSGDKVSWKKKGHCCPRTSAQTTSRFPFPDMILVLCTIIYSSVHQIMCDLRWPVEKILSIRKKERRSNERVFST